MIRSESEITEIMGTTKPRQKTRTMTTTMNPSSKTKSK